MLYFGMKQTLLSLVGGPDFSQGTEEPFLCGRNGPFESFKDFLTHVKGVFDHSLLLTEIIYE